MAQFGEMQKIWQCPRGVVSFTLILAPKVSGNLKFHIFYMSDILDICRKRRREHDPEDHPASRPHRETIGNLYSPDTERDYQPGTGREYQNVMVNSSVVKEEDEGQSDWWRQSEMVYQPETAVKPASTDNANPYQNVNFSSKP